MESKETDFENKFGKVLSILPLSLFASFVILLDFDFVFPAFKHSPFTV